MTDIEIIDAFRDMVHRADTLRDVVRKMLPHMPRNMSNNLREAVAYADVATRGPDDPDIVSTLAPSQLASELDEALAILDENGESHTLSIETAIESKDRITIVRIGGQMARWSGGRTLVELAKYIVRDAAKYNEEFLHGPKAMRDPADSDVISAPSPCILASELDETLDRLDGVGGNYSLQFRKTHHGRKVSIMFDEIPAYNATATTPKGAADHLLGKIIPAHKAALT